MSALRTVWVGIDALWTGWRGSAAIDRRQRARLRRLVRHARSASPYYRRLYAGLPADVTSPTSLPPTQKRDLMDHFDEWVTDPDVSLAALRRDFLARPALVGRRYLGRYHVVTTSGTTGEPAVLVHDAGSWAVQNLVGRRHEPRILMTPTVIGAVLRQGVRAAAVFVTGGHFAGPTMAASAVGTFPFLARSLRVAG